jgi:hypothetical protein
LPDGLNLTDLTYFTAANCTLTSTRAHAIRILIGGQFTGVKAIRYVRFSNMVAKVGVGLEDTTDNSSGIVIEDFSTDATRRISDVAIDGMTMDCSGTRTNPPAGIGHSLIIKRADRVQITNLRIDRPARAALIDDAIDVEMQECSISSPRLSGEQCLWAAKAANCTNLRIRGGHYRDPRSNHAVQLGSSSFFVFGFEVSHALIERISAGGSPSGIYLQNAVSGMVVGNRIIGFARYGIEEAGASNANNLIGNFLISNTLGPLNIIGTASEAIRNVTNVTNFQTLINDSGGFRQTLDGWVHASIANTTPVEMGRNNFAPWAMGAPAPAGAGRYGAARDGSVTGIVVTTTVAAPAASSLKVTAVKKTGAAGGAGTPFTLSVTLPVGATRAAILAAKDAHAFLAGDELSSRLRSQGGVGPAEWPSRHWRLRIKGSILVF